ncbi:FAD-dependent oxidoreductase [Cupriavidus basilensis]
MVGGGPAGLTAGACGGSGGRARILVDDQRELGGSLLSGRSEINGKPALQWVGEIEGKLRKLPEVTILSRSNAFGYQDHNLVTVTQRLTDHLPVSKRRGTRELLWKIRAKRVILATGAHERPIVFGNNDLPGVMMASAVSTYIHRYGVLPGRDAVVFTNNDRGYQAALDLKANGAKVTVVDPRASTSGALPALAKRQGVTVMNGAVVMAASGKRHVTSVNVTSYANGQSGSQVSKIPCDLVAMSGGLSPVLHLFAQSGGKAQWSDEKACFVPGKSLQAEVSVVRRRASSTWRWRCRSRWRLGSTRPRPPDSVPKRLQPRRSSRPSQRARCCRSGLSAAARLPHAGRSSSSTSRTTLPHRTSCLPRAKASNRSNM